MARQFKQIIEEAGEFSMQQREQTIRERMTLNLKEFAGKVAAFNKLGEALYGGGNFNKLAEELEEIASGAEAYTLRETQDSPFDQVTIKRNMKELRGYTTEFKKVAAEARALQERMTALYEDSGRVLSRYFEIKEYGSPDGMAQLPDKSENEKIVNARPGVREGLFGKKKEDVSWLQNRISDVNDRIARLKLQTIDNGSDKMADNAENLRKAKEQLANLEKRKAAAMKSESAGGMCEGCGKPMEQCECMNEGGPGSGVKGHKTTRPVKSAKFGQVAPAGSKTTTIGGKTVVQHPKHKNLYIMPKESVHESIKLKNIMEDINDDRPKEDWVKLDVPMLRYDVALEFEKDLKKKGFDVKRHDWKERAAQGEEFSEFFVKLKDFDEANKYAVGAYQSYDNNARMGEE